MENNEDIYYFRGLVRKLVEDPEIKSQEDLNETYESFIEDFSSFRKIKFYKNLPSLKPSTVDTTKKTFEKIPVHKAYLQKKNVVLKSNLWHELILTKKEICCDGFMVAQGKEKSVLDLTQLLLTEIDGKPAFILKLIRLKIDEEILNNKRLRESIKSKVENLLTKQKIESLEEIYPVVSRCRQFSVQEYFLPEGYSSVSDLKYATLLLRYDRVIKNPFLNKDIVHENIGMPNYFHYIYPQNINVAKYLSEAHFHFLEGFSNFSKQDNVKDRENNFGAGFAIPFSNVRGYILKLINEKYKTEDDKNFFLTNDFGMPFLNMYKSDKKLLEETLTYLEKINHKGALFEELINVNKLFDFITSVETKSLMVD